MSHEYSTIYKLEVYSAIISERRRQVEKWGDQFHKDTFWLAILGEEFGEIAKELADNYERTFYMNNQKDKDTYEKYRSNLKKEIIQTAAVCVAWLENFDGENNE